MGLTDYLSADGHGRHGGMDIGDGEIYRLVNFLERVKSGTLHYTDSLNC